MDVRALIPISNDTDGGDDGGQRDGEERYYDDTYNDGDGGYIDDYSKRDSWRTASMARVCTDGIPATTCADSQAVALSSHQVSWSTPNLFSASSSMRQKLVFTLVAFMRLQGSALVM